MPCFSASNNCVTGAGAIAEGSAVKTRQEAGWIEGYFPTSPKRERGRPSLTLRAGGIRSFLLDRDGGRGGEIGVVLRRLGHGHLAVLQPEAVIDQQRPFGGQVV